MINRMIGTLGILAILVATIWHWEVASEQLKDLLFYLLLATFVVQNIYLTLKKNKNELNFAQLPMISNKKSQFK